MTTMLQEVDHGDAEHFETTLEKFRQATVDQESYPQFVQQVDSTIAQVDQIIGSLQDDRADAKQSKERTKQAMSADLQALRDDGLDHKNLGENGAEGDLRRINRKLEVWYSFRAELERVKAAKLQAVLDEVDSREVWNRTWEKLEEMVDGKVEAVEEQQKAFEREMREDMQEHRQQVQDRNKEWYELQKERWDRREELVRDLLGRGLDVLDSLGADVSDLRDQLNTAAGDDLQVPTVAAETPVTDAGAEYCFHGKDVEEQYEVLQELVQSEPVDEMTEQEIGQLLDVSRGRFFDEDDGVLAGIEEWSGDVYPEFRDTDD